MLGAVIGLLGSCALVAQPLDTLPPLRSAFGLRDSVFYIGAWAKTMVPESMTVGTFERTVDSAGVTLRFPQRWLRPGVGDSSARANARLWEFAEAMGVDVIRRDMDWGGFSDALLDSAARAHADPDRFGLILSASKIIDYSGYGSEATFSFTDSIRYREEPTAFAYRSGGVDVANIVEQDDLGLTAREMRYDATNTAPGAVIASRPTFHWRPSRTNRWEWFDDDGDWEQRPDSTIQNSDYFFRRFHLRNDDTYYLAIEGHLFGESLAAADTAALLRVEVWYELPYRSRYLLRRARPLADTVVTATTNDSVLLARHWVRRADLKPLDSSNTSQWSAYRQALMPFRTKLAADGVTTGPTFFGDRTHPGNTSRRIDIKVYWTGAEPVALRALYLRDSIGNLLMTDDPALRRAICERAAAMVYRRPAGDSLDKRLTSVIALSLAGENPPIQAPALARVYRWVRECMNAGANPAQFSPPGVPPADSLPGWIDEVGNYGEAIQRLYDVDIVSSEGVVAVGHWMRDYVGAPHSSIPSIPEHNGGRFTPELYLRDSTVTLSLLDVSNPSTRIAELERYETMLQPIAMGQYIPLGADDPFPRTLSNVSTAAQVARDHRKRGVFIYFNIARLGFDISDYPATAGRAAFSRLDTIVGHIPEAAEQRAFLNVALSYGYKGIHYQTLDSWTNTLGDAYATGTRAGMRSGYMDDFGSVGTLTSDTAVDFRGGLWWSPPGESGWLDDTANGYLMRNVYLGFGVRSRETRRYNAWIRDSIGPYLMKLNWRDAYSIHYTVPQPYALKTYIYRDRYDAFTYRSVGYRPIASDEIVSEVRSYRRDWTGSGAARREVLVADSLARTYVELGLFHRKNPTSDRRNDTSYVMLVNRRAFERSDDIPPTSERGRLLDSLAEMRVITLRLYPAAFQRFGRFTFVRVRELGADRTPLPLASAPRTHLDTIVRIDSAIRITLRPGGAALLRVTYALPDSNDLPDEVGAIPFDAVPRLQPRTRRPFHWSRPFRAGTTEDRSPRLTSDHSVTYLCRHGRRSGLSRACGPVASPAPRSALRA